jgi:small subunit ribosomal protein S14
LAKTSMIVKEEKRIAKAAKGKLPKVKLHNRCSLCGRPRSYYRLFGTCRLCLRKLASEGKLPGVTKSSW